MVKHSLQIDKKRFFVSLGASFGGLGVLLTTLFSTGTAFAAFPIAGVGGFVVSAKSIHGEGFQQFATVGATSEKSSYPQAGIKLNTVTIKGLQLTKDLDVSSQFGGLISKVRVQISADPDKEVTGGEVEMHVSGITADDAQFNSLDINESYSTDPTHKINLAASALDLTNALMNTHSMHASSMSIPGMSVKVLALDAAGNVLLGNF
jgi:hypothetical protein